VVPGLRLTRLLLAAVAGLGPAAAAFAQAPAATRAEAGRPGWLVVAPAAWEADLRPLVELRARDFQASFLALEDALAEGDGADAPERLKRVLWRRWREQGLAHVLLAGDAATLPVRFMVLDRNTEAAWNTAFYPSDLYYADLAREDGSFDDWNGQREGIHDRWYGEVRGEHHKDSPINYDGISWIPEIAVGRWPVADRAALQAVVAKTLAWEERLRGEAAPRALAVHPGGWVDVRERLAALDRDLAAAGWQVQEQFHGRLPEPGPAATRDAILAGQELVFHAGHGTATGWHACLGPAEATALAAAPPAVYVSVGCSTGRLCTEPPYGPWLDVAGILHRGTNAGEVLTAPPLPPAPLQPGRLAGAGLGARLLAMPGGGAVAYLGCATGAQPCAVTLLEGFLQAVAGGAPRLGDAWRAALRHYHAAEALDRLVPTESWYPPSIFFQGMKFLLYGDPALPLPRPRAAAIRGSQVPAGPRKDQSTTSESSVDSGFTSTVSRPRAAARCTGSAT